MAVSPFFILGFVVPTLGLNRILGQRVISAQRAGAAFSRGFVRAARYFIEIPGPASVAPCRLIV